MTRYVDTLNAITLPDPVLYDGFDATDGTLLAGRTAPSGQGWTDDDTHTCVIQGNRFVRVAAVNPASPTRAGIDLGQSPSSMAAVASWTGTSASASENEAVVLITSASPDRVGGGPANPLRGIFFDCIHAVFGYRVASITIYINGVLTDIGMNAVYRPDSQGTVTADGSPTNVGIYLHGITLTAQLPDGSILQRADARFASRWGRYLLWQLTGESAPNMDTRFDAVQATTDPLPGFLPSLPLPTTPGIEITA